MKLHHKENGFQNLNRKLPKHGFKDFLYWRRNREGNMPSYDDGLGLFPLKAPNWLAINNQHDKLRATWLGHASMLVQMEGLNILTDPIFSQRCSPFSFAGPRRYTPAPMELEQLPVIHVVLISHNHYDHLDLPTVQALGNGPLWLVPLGLKEWLNSQGITNVIELDWWESTEFKGMKFVSTPTQHFSGRGLMDRNKTLWCSWSVVGSEYRFWFGGDTGYADFFTHIGEKYGPFDLAAIPIGAYNPEWFMGPMHVNPEDAVQIHRDVQSRKSIGIHWGTFILTDEPLVEPPVRLKKAAQDARLTADEFITLTHGETLVID